MPKPAPKANAKATPAPAPAKGAERPRVLLASVHLPTELRTVNTPIGLLSLASSLKGADVKILAQKEMPEKNFAKAVREFSPHHIGVTIYPSPFPEMNNEQAKLLKRLRKLAPSASIIAGGPAVHKAPVGVLESFPADFFIKGEAELPFAKLIKAAGTRHVLSLPRKTLEAIPGAIFRNNAGALHVSPKLPRASAEFLGKLKLDWRLLDPDTYFAELFTTRGCKGKCVFCTRPQGTKIRAQSPQKIVDEIKRLRKARPDVTHVVFNDDTFAHDRQRAVDLANLIVREGLHKKYKFALQTTVGSLLKNGEPDSGLIGALKKMNTIFVYLGTENLSKPELERMGKGKYTPAQALKVAREISRHGMVPDQYIILTNPHTALKDLINTAYLVSLHRAKPAPAGRPPVSYAVFHTLEPGFGTPFYRKLESEGKLRAHVEKNYPQMFDEPIIGKVLSLARKKADADLKKPENQRTPAENRVSEILLDVHNEALKEFKKLDAKKTRSQQENARMAELGEAVTLAAKRVRRIIRALDKRPAQP